MAQKKTKTRTISKKKKKGRTVDTWKTKRWYKIKSPKAFEEKEIGQAVSSDPKLLMNRVINTTLREITGNIPHQNIKLKFKVVDVKGESIETVPLGYELNRGYIQRQTKRMHTVLNTLTDVITKDGYRIRVKALTFGHGGMRVAQEKEIRRLTKEYITEIGKNTAFEKLLMNMIHGKVGSEIYKKAKKIYPITKSEIVKVKLLAAPTEKK